MSTQAQQEIEIQAQMIAMMRREVDAAMDEEMGQLYNQFVSFISSTQLPLPQVALVLDMVKLDTVRQAFKHYVGD